MKGSNFVIHYVYLLYYKCHLKNLNPNPINKKGNRCFQYTVTVTLNHEETAKHVVRITKI